MNIRYKNNGTTKQYYWQVVCQWKYNHSRVTVISVQNNHWFEVGKQPLPTQSINNFEQTPIRRETTKKTQGWQEQTLARQKYQT